MTNLEKYTKVFAETLSIDPSTAEGVTFQSVPQWNSVGHMILIANMEMEFNIEFEPDDIINYNSYQVGIDMLRNYGINF